MTQRPAWQSGPSENKGALVWVIDTGLPGATNQCLGIANAMPFPTKVVKLRLRSSRLAPLFKAAMNAGAFSRNKPRWFTNLVYRLLFSGPSLSCQKPDVSISTLGRSEIPALFLQKFFGSFALHIGVPTRTPSSCFDLIVRLPSQQMEALDCPAVTVDIAPTAVRLESVRAYTSPLVARWRKQERRLLTVLIGGDGNGYKYRPDEWRSLAQGLADLAKNQDLRILLTTSRRTGPIAEKVLKSNAASQSSVIHVVWFNDSSPSIIIDYLAAAEAVICTEESRSMISDAVAAGKNVYTVQPNYAHSRDPRLIELLQTQEAERRIKRITLDQIASLDLDGDALRYFRPRTECWSAELLRGIERSLPDLWQLMRETANADAPARGHKT